MHIMNSVRYIEHLQCPKLKFSGGTIIVMMVCLTNRKDGSRPGQPKTVVTNASIAAVAGLIKRDASFTVKIFLIVLAYHRYQLISF